MILNYSVLNFKLHDGHNHDAVSPCSLNMNPLHLGHGLTSSLNLLRDVHWAFVVTVTPFSIGINVCSA